MTDDFRKKMFRGAKIEDLILDFDALSKECEEHIQRSEDLSRQRFFEGMSIAYKTVSMKLKGAFDYMEPNLLEELYKQVTKIDMKQEFKKLDPNIRTEHTCSFCGKNESEVKSLVMGPLVAICDNCLDFGKQLAEEKSI